MLERRRSSRLPPQPLPQPCFEDECQCRERLSGLPAKLPKVSVPEAQTAIHDAHIISVHKQASTGILLCETKALKEVTECTTHSLDPVFCLCFARGCLFLTVGDFVSIRGEADGLQVLGLWYMHAGNHQRKKFKVMTTRRANGRLEPVSYHDPAEVVSVKCGSLPADEVNGIFKQLATAKKPKHDARQAKHKQVKREPNQQDEVPRKRARIPKKAHKSPAQSRPQAAQFQLQPSQLQAQAGATMMDRNVLIVLMECVRHGGLEALGYAVGDLADAVRSMAPQTLRRLVLYEMFSRRDEKEEHFFDRYPALASLAGQLWQDPKAIWIAVQGRGDWTWEKTLKTLKDNPCFQL